MCIDSRHSLRVSQTASALLKSEFQADTMGKVVLGIFKSHFNANIVYELDDEAMEAFESIYDKYNGQYNMKYAGMFTM